MPDEIKRKRGRPKKVAVTENQKILTDEDNGERLRMSEQKLTMNDVNKSLRGLYDDFFRVGEGYASATTLPDMNLWNPFLQNTRLKLINSYPSQYSPDEIAEAAKNPQNHEEMLRGAAASLSATQYLYYKILREASDIPMFKHYILPPTLTESEYLSKEFDKEEEFVENWANAWHMETQFKKIQMEVKREGKPSYLFRQCIVEEDGKKKTKHVIFQKLPSNFVKLTALGEFGYITSFNMLIFLQPAFYPEQYPEYIQNIWHKLLDDDIVVYNNRLKKYEVSDTNKLVDFTYKDEKGKERRGTFEAKRDGGKKLMTYLYWVQLPADLCFCFASDMSNAWAVPDTTGLFSSLQELTDYSTLAGLIASSPLTAVLTGQVEFVDGAKPGQDETRISAHLMDAFQNIFNQMVPGNISAYFAPFKDLKLQSLPNIPNSSDIKTKAVQNFVATAGEGGLIVATDKPSVAMIKGAQRLAESQYDFVTRQIQDVVNFVLERWCDCKYKWQIELWGGVYTFDDRVRVMKEMVAGGATYLLPKLASADNYSMRQIKGITTYIDANKIYDKFKTLGWAQTQQIAKDGGESITSKVAESVKVGRKEISESDIENDSTAQSRETGANITELKSDYAEMIRHNRCVVCGDIVEDGHLLCPDCEDEMEIEGGGE